MSLFIFTLDQEQGQRDQKPLIRISCFISIFYVTAEVSFLAIRRGVIVVWSVPCNCTENNSNYNTQLWYNSVKLGLSCQERRDGLEHDNSCNLS
ncbi:hypothetical protein MUK42_37178 [Musa troglodytarum]|uniref:Uncharacterized protein n=1 Tax=Musa troglodytarum TaxID=320322 RepID=A0A9E7GAU3_9LILI|nr:hypothetical protein MUK42_37178 [Musa troglodytarum]